MRILVTGDAGFIGYHVVKRLLERGDQVIGIDVVNDYYDPSLKQARLLENFKRAKDLFVQYQPNRLNLADRDAINECFAQAKPERVIHLAAQAGVRYSLENPQAYVESNLLGYTNILEACRAHGVEHLTYASTSSVYGANTKMPFSEHHGVDHPLQFYAATKRANELMAHAYSHLFHLPTTGLRFFTVYGPWGRPDMAPFLFTKSIIEGTPIRLFNGGDHIRDFTFVDDIAEGVVRASDAVARSNPDWTSDAPDPASSDAPFRIYNIGNSEPVHLLDFLAAIEEATGKQAIRVPVEAQPGDVHATFADMSELETRISYKPSISVKDGVQQFVDWYKMFYRV